jgi:DNA modification methylase
VAVIEQEIADLYAMYNGDSCQVLPTLPSGSVHFSVYSPPFAVDGGGCLYNYSSSEQDLSNSRTYKEFFEHYEFIVKEIARLTLPGRISAVHCMDVPRDGANVAGYSDFPGDIIRLHEKHGFEYLPRICIWKEPLEVRNRTMAKALAHRQIVEDSTKTNVAAADYLIPFRKKGENPIPVTHPVGLLGYAGSRQIPSKVLHYRGWTGAQTSNRYSHWIWRQYASCFWDDIRLGRVLPYKEARDKDDERHMHPLQLDVIERACVLWSNPGEVVLTPFAGVGSELVGALMNGRKAIGVELKPAYFNQALKNLREASAAVARGEQQTLFSAPEDDAPDEETPEDES